MGVQDFSALLGERASAKYGNCQIEHFAICCRYCANVDLSLTKYVHGHWCLSYDSDLIRFISWYCWKYGRSKSCIDRNIMFCIQLYNCNVEKVCSGLMNDVIKSFVITSTDSHHVAVANLLREIVMVRDHFLTFPQWFTRDYMDDIISSICVLWTVRYMCVSFYVFICVMCFVSVSVYLVLRIRF